MSDKYGTHSVPKPKQNKFLIYKKVVFKIISTLINKYKTFQNKIINFCNGDNKTDFI